VAGSSSQTFNESLKSYIRTDIVRLYENLTAGMALSWIRKEAKSDKISYFYVTDEEDRLIGVLPIRKLLLADPEAQLTDLIVRSVIAIPESAALSEAFQLFRQYKFLALPVVDANLRLVGSLDITLFAGRDITDFGYRAELDDIFETIGVKLEGFGSLGPFAAFSRRFPWIIPTIISGTVCALMAGFFEKTISESLVIAFFLALILGLGESVSMQSLSIAISELNKTKPTFLWYIRRVGREILTLLLMGLTTACVIAGVIIVWKSDLAAGLAIGGSIVLSLITAGTIGLSVPAILHALKLDPKIAAGPLALALSDVFTIFFYLGIAALVL